jgi:UPF0176 protein
MFHISFYQFTPVTDALALAESLRQLAHAQQILGVIDVAPEGISGAVAGTSEALDAFEAAVQGRSESPSPLPGVRVAAFEHMVFKRTACKTAPFTLLKVKVCDELIRLGLSEAEMQGVDATHAHGVSLDPEAWRELLAADDVVLIDNRNSFEFALGRFKGAIDPQVAHYRDFAQFIKQHLPEWKAQHKRVAMYCTGGIRCEKTAAWLSTLDTPVYQLEGGILNYLATMLDAEKDWSGECFVFDKRMALDAKLQETDTDIDDVFDETRDGAWRIARARRLAGQ